MRARAPPVPLGAGEDARVCVCACVYDGVVVTRMNLHTGTEGHQRKKEKHTGGCQCITNATESHLSSLLSVFHKSTHSLLLSHFLPLFFQKQSIFLGSLATYKQNAARGVGREGWREA
ncbi:hypothetical protein CHARACLAT_027990 [Characodon lateralis]|uniref:Uncharacterized protein n=1 Tax=Characodon lateralis TaxID=208331 RepID=A0ABU7DKJ4_9TELE|nr:hypothetical protein [Characodon lateralis]